jgi:pilus assembly protein Flp/PilA
MVREDHRHRTTQMFDILTKLWKSEGGATAIEYGLIAALIAVAAIAAFQLVGTSLTAVFNGTASAL